MANNQIDSVIIDEPLRIYRESTSFSNAQPELLLYRTRGGFVPSVGNADAMGAISFYGDTGTNSILGAQIQGIVIGAVSATRIPTALRFLTCPVAGIGAVPRLEISPDGEVSINTPTTVTNTALTVNGGVDVQSGALTVTSTATIGSGLTVSFGGFTSTGTTRLASLGAGSMVTDATGTVSVTTQTNGQLLIGSTGAAPVAASLTSPDGSIVFTPGAGTLALTVGGVVADVFQTDAGNAVPALGTLILSGGSNIGTTAAGNVVTINLDNSPSVSGSLTAATNVTTSTGNLVATAGNLLLPTTTSTVGQIQINGSRFMHAYSLTTANSNTFLGLNAGNLTTALSNCVGIGFEALQSIGNDNSKSQNVAVGYRAAKSLVNVSSTTAIGGNALGLCVSGTGNSAVGGGCLFSCTGSSNTGLGFNVAVNATAISNTVAIGSSALSNMGAATSTNNLCLGFQAGYNYVSTESSNILLNSTGIAAESNTLRVGSGAGAGSGQLTRAFIHGIYGITPAVAAPVSVIIDSAGQLGTTTAGGGVYSWIRQFTSPATLVVNTGYIADNAVGIVAFSLPASAFYGQIIRIVGSRNGWTVAQGANQQIHFGNQSTTLGAGGSLASTHARDTIELVCVIAGAATEWQIISSVGNITVA